MLKFLALLAMLSFTVSSFGQEYRELVSEYIKLNASKIARIKENLSVIKGVEIIVADKGKDIASRYGHGLLRLVDNDGLWFNDVVISFSALSFEEKYTFTKGVFGGYSVTPQVMTLHDYWKLYTEDEERNLIRHVINLDQEKLNRFLDVLFKYLEKPELLKNYTFLSNNCIGIITRMFTEAEVAKGTVRAPMGVTKWVEKNKLSHYPTFTIKNYAYLRNQKEFLNINDLSHQELLKTFTTEELGFILFTREDLDEEKADIIAAIMRKEKLDLDQIYNFNKFHWSLYQDIQDEEKYMSKEDLERTISYREKLKHTNTPLSDYENY